MKKITLLLVATMFCLFNLSAQQYVFYGTTTTGGANGSGTIFKYNLSSATETVLYSFSSSTGDFPLGSLAQDPTTGILYGAAYSGGMIGAGVLYSFNPSTNAYTVIHNFVGTPGNDGSEPFLNQAAYYNGTFYGMTYQGGTYNDGIIFSYTPSTNQYNILVNFDDSTGGLAHPEGEGLVLHNGILYGETAYGGINDNGTIFRFNPATDKDSVLFMFNDTDGDNPENGQLAFDSKNGLFYGTTLVGGIKGAGVIFSFNPTTGQENVLFNFDSAFGAPTGGYPYADVLFDSAQGLLYGVTGNGGANDLGVLYSFNPSTGIETPIANIDGTDSLGALPFADLVMGPCGIIYGAAAGGGTVDGGTIFSYNTITGQANRVYSFTGTPDGSSPRTNLTLIQVSGPPNAPLPMPPTITISTSSNPICSGSPTTLTASGAATYLWSDGETTAAITVSPVATTTYSVTGTSSGCSSTANSTITVNNCPPGSNCYNAIGLSANDSLTSYPDSMKASSMKWYSFVAGATNLQIFVTTLSISTGNIYSMGLYSSCTGSPIKQSTASSINQDTLVINDSLLTPGNTYYLLLKDSSSGATFYNVRIDNPQTMPWAAGGCFIGPGGPPCYSFDQCGVNYAYASTPIHGRYDYTGWAAKTGPGPVPYVTSNKFSLPITTAPSNNVTVLAAYVLFTVVNADCNYTGQFTLSLPSGGSITYSQSSLGAEECVFCSFNTCWDITDQVNINTTPAPYNYQYSQGGGCHAVNSVFDVFDNTISYCIPVTIPSGLINGTYTITGLPQYNLAAGISPGNNAPNCTSGFGCNTFNNCYNASIPLNYMDCDGATLIIIYADPCQNNKGHFNMQFNPAGSYGGGTTGMAVQFGCKSYVTAPAGNSNASSFFIGADFEDQKNDTYTVNGSGVTKFNPNVNIWNTQVDYVAAGGGFPVSSSNVPYTWTSKSVYGASDCYDIVALGAYYQYPGSCSSLAVTVTPSSSTVCAGIPTTLTATGAGVGGTYSWSPSTGLSSSTGSSVIANPGSTTTYTVTGTTTAGCTAIATATITVNPQPTVTITPPTTTFCTGGSVTLIASGTNITSYSWSNGATTSSITVSPAATTTYSVTVANSNNTCFANASSVITVNPVPVITITGNNLTCQAPPFHYTVTAGAPASAGPFTYSWSFNGSKTTTVTTPNTTYTFNLSPPPPTTGGYLVVTVNTAQGCSAVDTLVIRGCCNNGLLADANGDVSNLAAYFSGHVTTLKGITTFYNYNTFQATLIGVFTVNANLVINADDIVFGPLGKIDVLAPYTLTIVNSHLHACSSMWDGIYVEPGANLVIENSLIEDALNAVVSLNSPGLIGNFTTKDNTYFNKDFVGISVRPYSGTHTGIVNQTTFSCYLDAYSFTLPGTVPSKTLAGLLYPHLTNRSSAGININGVGDIVIGDQVVPTNQNVFDNLDVGIHAVSSTLNIYNNLFQNIFPVSTPFIANTYQYDIGILGTNNNKLFIGNAPSPALNTFTSCTNGIWVTGTTAQVSIFDNKFTPGSITSNYNILLFHNVKARVLVEYNQMTNLFNTGVFAQSNTGSITAISSNTITNASHLPGSVGVRVLSIPAGGTGYSVTDNTIGNIEYGIIGMNLKSLSVLSNTVNVYDFSRTYPTYGIEAANSSISAITTNTVTLASTTTLNAQGIGVINGAGSDIVECNNTDNESIGISFDGVSTNPSTMAGNKMNSNIDEGLLLYAGAIIGPQGNPTSIVNDNEWLGSFTGPPWATNCLGGANGNLSPFYVRNNAGFDPPVAINTAVPGFYTIKFHTVASPVAAVTCTGSNGSASPLLTVTTAMQIINDSNQFTMYSDESHWMEQHALISYLHIHDSLLTHPPIKHFRDSVLQANMGYLDSANVLLGDTNGVSSADLSGAQTLLGMVNKPNKPEEALVDVYTILIAMDKDSAQVPDKKQTKTLQGIAKECPYQYGPAVWIARAMLVLVDSTEYVNNCEVIPPVSSGNHKMVRPQGDSTLSAKVYPNPANSMLNVEVPLGINETANICLYSDMGQVVKCEVLKSNITTLPINDLAAGIYYYRIILSNGDLIKSDKVMILH